MRLPSDGVYVVEHKTTSLDIGPGSQYWRRLTLDDQVSNYVAGARALGHEPRGVLFDVVRKVNLKPYLATPEAERKYTQPSSKACPECKKKKATPAPHYWNKVADEWVLDEASMVGGATPCLDGRIVTDPGGRLYANLREHDETLDEYRLRVREDIGNNPDKYYQRGIVVRLEEEERDAAFDVWAVGREIRESQLANRWPRNPNACDSFGSLCQYFDVCTKTASIDDPLRFRTSDKAHEELAVAAAGDVARIKHKSISFGDSLPILSTSSARCYRTCPRKYFFSYEMKRRSARDAPALRFGSLFHIGLEKWWRCGDLAQAFAAMRAEYQKFEIDEVDAVRAEELLLGYHVMWKDEPLEVLAVEVEFRAPLVNPATDGESRTWQRGGKIDALVRSAAP